MNLEIDRINRLSEFEFVQELMTLGFIHMESICGECNKPMVCKPTKDCIDGVNWRCMTYQCVKYQSTKRVRYNSWTGQFKVSAKNLVKFLVYWSYGFEIRQIEQLTGINLRTIRRIRLFILQKLCAFYECNPVKLGGLGVTVQIDETMLNHKAKSHRGRLPKEQIWALVMADTSRTPSRCFVKIVENRSAGVLIPLICSTVRNGSTIYTDEFRTYGKLKDFNYVHKTVCHKYNFVDPLTGVHTQHVESCNNNLKHKICASRGVKKTFYKFFIIEFMFFNHYLTGHIAYYKILDILK